MALIVNGTTIPDGGNVEINGVKPAEIVVNGNVVWRGIGTTLELTEVGPGRLVAGTDIPANVSINVCMCGGGGSGGDGLYFDSNNFYSGGGGGGSEALSTVIGPFSSGVYVDYYIGAGGVAGNNNSGEDSIIYNVTAPGGVAANSAVGGGNGGSGAYPNVSCESNGDDYTSACGGSHTGGLIGSGASPCGAGGGGGAGAFGNGANGGDFTTLDNGHDAEPNTGAGGGGGAASLSFTDGGAGGSGKIVLSWGYGE